MMAPYYYREARMGAPYFILGEILEWEGHNVRVKVKRAFRGWMRRGRVLTLGVSISCGGPIVLGEMSYSDKSWLSEARYVEAFLDGAPPKVVMDQIKFLRDSTGRPSGDPSRESFLW
jgi:hypothetical protein